MTEREKARAGNSKSNELILALKEADDFTRAKIIEKLSLFTGQGDGAASRDYRAKEHFPANGCTGHSQENRELLNRNYHSASL